MTPGSATGWEASSGATHFPLPNWQSLDWGLSQINLNHGFTASIIDQLPFGKDQKWGSKWNGAANAIGRGWELTVIQKATSGFPIFVVNSNNTSGQVSSTPTLQSRIRPSQICNPVLSHPTLAEWFNPECFAQRADAELENANRTPLDGPRFVNTDFSVIKHFDVRESLRVNFRVLQPAKSSPVRRARWQQLRPQLCFARFAPYICCHQLHGE
jgi:hypothetical protein